VWIPIDYPNRGAATRLLLCQDFLVDARAHEAVDEAAQSHDIPNNRSMKARPPAGRGHASIALSHSKHQAEG
jgi:hypothetical protein